MASRPLLLLPLLLFLGPLFLAGEGVSRHQFFADLVLLFRLTPPENLPPRPHPLNDLAVGHPHFGAINLALENKLMRGFPDGHIHSEWAITHEATAIFLARLISIAGYQWSFPKKFPAIPPASSLGKALAVTGALFPADRFNPDERLSPIHFAEIKRRLGSMLFTAPPPPPSNKGITPPAAISDPIPAPSSMIPLAPLPPRVTAVPASVSEVITPQPPLAPPSEPEQGRWVAHFPEHKNYFFLPDEAEAQGSPLPTAAQLFQPLELLAPLVGKLESTLDELEFNLLNPALSRERWTATRLSLERLLNEVSRGTAKLKASLDVLHREGHEGLLSKFGAETTRLLEIHQKFSVFEKRLSNDIRYIQAKLDLMEYVKNRSQLEALSVEGDFRK